MVEGQAEKEVAPPPPAPAEATKDVAEEKAVIPTEEKPDDSKALAVVESTFPPPSFSPESVY